MRVHRLRRLLAPVFVVALAIGAFTVGHDTPPAGALSGSVAGMKILITNDDGVQPGNSTLGLFELRKALCDAGADVIVVGPWSNQSGASAAITYGSADTKFTLTEPTIVPDYASDCASAPSAGAVYGGCVTSALAPPPCDGTQPTLTPADTATLGATAAVQAIGGWTAGPDLVISGINAGGNDGLNVNISGTLGAATIASSLGYPSIAISASSSPSGNPGPNYVAAAAWSTTLVGVLNSNGLLPTGYVLSVNYPRVDRGYPTEAVWTTVSQQSPLATNFTDEGGLSFGSSYGPCTAPTCKDPLPGTDSVAYNAGQISVSAISVDRTLGSEVNVSAVQALIASGALNPTPSNQPPPAAKSVVPKVVVGGVVVTVPNGAPAHVALVGGALTPSTQGGWTVSADGGVFTAGDAQFYGSLGGIPLVQPIVGIAPTPTGAGYWLVAADGGVFSFGDAAYHGSLGGLVLNQPIVGMTSIPGGAGYWLVASDGGVFSFGAAQFHGSLGGTPLHRPINAITSTRSGNGYYLLAEDAGVFTFGDAGFYGSLGGGTRVGVNLALSSAQPGYWILTADDQVTWFGG